MESNDKKIEAFVDKMMANGGLEKPSTQFTSHILNSLDIESKALTYKPLIPKWVWSILLVAVSFIVFYALFNHEASNASSKFSEFLNFSQIDFRPLQNVDFNFSKTLIYAMVVFTIMIGLQVPLLKSYVNNHLKF